jgi:hypothetical protein
MFNPIKAYNKSREIQFEWIRSHPVQYVALNATLLAVYFGYQTYQDRKELRKFEKEMKQNFDQLIHQ